VRGVVIAFIWALAAFAALALTAEPLLVLVLGGAAVASLLVFLGRAHEAAFPATGGQIDMPDEEPLPPGALPWNPNEPPG
jgi:hypothetical protein